MSLHSSARDLLNDETRGADGQHKEPSDKLRLFMIWFLSTEQEISRADMDRFEEALTKSGADISALTYVKQADRIPRL